MRPRQLPALALVLLLSGCHGDSSPDVAASGPTSRTPVATPASTASLEGAPESRCDGTTVAMGECLAEVLADVERQLNVVYRKVRQQLLDSEAEGEFTDIDEAHDNVHPAAELREAERAFLVYRDRMCDAMYDAWITGTIRSLNALGCQISVTREQISQITAMVGP